MRGLFITFEGVEGSGKSTQISLLRGYIEERGLEVEVMREPGGVPISEAIRHILLEPANHAMSPTAELLLYEAARAQLVDERIRPALESGRVVISDRYADSTTAYQGAGRNLAPETVEELHRIATRGIWPDLTLVLDVPPETGLERAARARGKDRLESEPVEFHQRVRAGYLAIAEREPERVFVLDASRSPEDVAEETRQIVAGLLERRGLLDIAGTGDES